MELNFKSIPGDYIKITKEFILSKLTPKQIIEYYLQLDLKFSTLINSPFREDKNPSFGIKVIDDYNVIGTDFARNNESYDCFKIVSSLHNNCTFTESLKIIAADFKLLNFNNTISKSEIPLLLNTSDSQPIKNYKKLFVVEDQPYTRVDVEYWGKYRISISTLVEYDVLSCKRLWSNGELLKKYTANNPVYAYKFTNNGNVSYKIYSPLADKKNKWLFNGSSSDIEGFDQLPLFDDILIITKSLKDVMCLKEHGINAISLQGEANNLSNSVYEKIKYRFNNIYSLYDFDTQGIYGAEKLLKEYGIKPLYIPIKTNCKDFAEFCSLNNYEDSKKLVEKLISKSNDK